MVNIIGLRSAVAGNEDTFQTATEVWLEVTFASAELG